MMKRERERENSQQKTAPGTKVLITITIIKIIRGSVTDLWICTVEVSCSVNAAFQLFTQWSSSSILFWSILSLSSSQSSSILFWSLLSSSSFFCHRILINSSRFLCYALAQLWWELFIACGHANHIQIGVHVFVLVLSLGLSVLGVIPTNYVKCLIQMQTELR